jgi:hypothetical protein
MLRGHHFLNSDTEDSPPIAIITEAMAGRYWPG